MTIINTAEKIIKSGFDISLLATPAKLDKTHVVEVMFDDEGNMQAGFEIVGKNSTQYRDVIRETSTSAIQRSQQKKQQIDAKTSAGAGTLFDLGENRNQKIAIAVTVGAPGFTDNGEPVKLTPEFLNMCFDARPTWQEQILVALEADANFLAI
jgi:hypothetical protein